MRIPSEFFENLRQRVSVTQIVAARVSLTRKGYESTGLCPFHNEKTPSFTVNDAKRFYHCFGCGAHGDVIKFVSETEGLSYTEAAIKIAENNGIELPKLSQKEAEAYDETEEIQKVVELANYFFIEQIKRKENRHVVDYLVRRGISEKQINDFDIGYASGNGTLQNYLESKKVPLLYMQKAGLIGKKENGLTYEIFWDRVTFPIKNIFNKTIAFGARALGASIPKYLNSPETLIFKKNETLYGENKATAAAYKKNKIILVEGYIDAIAMQSNGFEESVASLGTAVTVNHLNKMWRVADEIVLCLDGDQAGLKATIKAIELALAFVNNNKTLSLVLLPAGLDPDELIKSDGKQRMAELVDRRLPLSEAIWYIETNGKNFTTAEHYASLETKLGNYTKSIKDKIVSKSLYLYFSEKLWLLRNKKKYLARQKTSGTLLTIADHKFSEIEHLEYTIFSLITKFPRILTDIRNVETISNLHISNSSIKEFQQFIFDHLNEIIEYIDTEQEEFNIKIDNLFKNSRFFDLYTLLSKSNSIFLDTQFLNIKYTSETLWDIILKRYNLAIMKKEYISLLETYNEESFQKAQNYKKAIDLINLELEKRILDDD